MKKIIPLFAAVIGLATTSQAQTAYNMTITKVDGTTVVIPADSVTSVTFAEAQTPQGDKTVYEHRVYLRRTLTLYVLQQVMK